MTTNYEDLIPKKVLFNLRDIETIGLIKVSTIKKILSKGGISAVRIGNKLHIARAELIKFLESNTIQARMLEGGEI